MAEDKEFDHRGQMVLDKIRRERERLETQTASTQKELQEALAQAIRDGAREGVSADILTIFKSGTTPRGALARSLQSGGGGVYGDFDDDV